MFRLKAWLWRYLTEKMHLQWTMRSGLDVKVRDYADWCTYNELFVDGEYDEAIQKVLSQLEHKKSLTVLDLGANLGYFSLRFADLFLRLNIDIPVHLYMVEGSPFVRDELEARTHPLVARGMHLGILSGLVGKKTGYEMFNFAKESNQNFIGSKDRDVWKAVRGARRVDYINLDKEISASKIDLIKCDIEGAEFDFIDSYEDLLRKTNYVVFEFHEAFGSVEDAKAKLKTYGFVRNKTLRDSQGCPIVMFARVG